MSLQTQAFLFRYISLLSYPNNFLQRACDINPALIMCRSLVKTKSKFGSLLRLPSDIDVTETSNEKKESVTDDVDMKMNEEKANSTKIVVDASASAEDLKVKSNFFIFEKKVSPGHS